MDDMQPLVGEVKSQFTYGDPESYAALVEAAREEQEAMCGYPLVVKSTRQVETRDMQGRLVIEVFATFAPTPEAIQQEAAENDATKAEGEAMRAAHLAATHSD